MIEDLGPKETKHILTPIHTLSFDELRSRAQAGETFVSLQGYPVSTRDHKWDERRAMDLWMGDLSHMNKQKPATPDQPILNKKGKPFSWSPSAINDFITCPAQYAAKRFYFTVPYEESEAMRQGTIEHKHLEDRLKFKTPLPDGYTRGEKFCQAYEAVEQKGGVIHTELKIAFTSDLRLVDWYDKDAWGRCIIDLAAILNLLASIGDWKTGKKKNDLLQLKVCACALSLMFPDIEKFTTKYIWLKDGEMSPKAPEGVFTRDQIPELWDEILGHTTRMQQAWEYEEFHAKQGGLCRSWCSVKECIHCGGKR